MFLKGLFVYFSSIKRELKTRPTYECRCHERLKTKPEESTHLVYTGLLVELEHLKMKTTLIDEMLTSVMGEYVFTFDFLFVYYESIKRGIKRRLIYWYR